MRTEKDIINQLRQGHHDALASLMSQYQNYVYSILKSMLYPEEAQEATQDTFIKIFKNIKQYNEQSKLTTWMYRIAYRTGLDYLKKRKSFYPINHHHESIATEEDAVNLDQRDIHNWIKSELGKLDPSDAVLIKLYYLNEYSIQEVAEISGLTTSNVKVKLFRIRNQLKAQMSHFKLSDLID